MTTAPPSSADAPAAFVQPDLFGDFDARQAAAAARKRERDRWAAQFERAAWVAPHDTAGGLRAGESKPGWRCPVCGEVEPNGFWLHLNHGWDPGVPGDRPWHGYCHRAAPPGAVDDDEDLDVLDTV